MSERLTVSLDDGILEKLRTLAGGERKVGEYLSRLIATLPDGIANVPPELEFDSLGDDTATLTAFIALGREIAQLQWELQHTKMRVRYYQSLCGKSEESEPSL